jgi:hypothetical protein
MVKWKEFKEIGGVYWGIIPVFLWRDGGKLPKACYMT